MTEEEFYAKLPKPPPPIHYSTDDIGDRVDRILRGIDLIQRMSELREKVVDLKQDCVRQTPEEWERLRCDSRKKELQSELESIERENQKLYGEKP